MGAANLDGDDGTALWLTRMVSGTEAADVRGRQAAWLLVVAPVMLALTVTLTALSGPGRGWRPRSRRCWARPPAWGCCCR
jgi:ABC-2 type transport system permease protein